MRPKKSLGQNFLKSQEALRAIIEAADLHHQDVVLEVGPGKGALTQKLLDTGATVFAVEKDEQLIEILRETFATEIENKKLVLIADDIVEFDLTKISAEHPTYKVVANIPYYITGILIRKLLTAPQQPERLVLLVQKEVALRIVAKDKKESILSMSVKAYGTPKYILTVKAKYFSPEPSVDSAIIQITTISRNFFSDISEDAFFEIMKAGFAHKRKQLAGNLKEHFQKDFSEILLKNNISPTVRAEDITLEDWKKILRG